MQLRSNIAVASTTSVLTPLAGRGSPAGSATSAIVELGAWVEHRRRRVVWKQAVGHHLQSLLDWAFPGASGCAHRLLATEVGRLVVAEFTDPVRLARLGVSRFQGFARRRGIRVSSTKAEQLVAAARQALPTADAAVAREAIATDLELLETLQTQTTQAEAQLQRLLPSTPFAVLTSTPGWGTVRAAAYGGAVGDPARWQSAKKLYRASGLTPTVYESAGRRVDGGISREGSVALRQALLALAIGLRHQDAPSRRYAQQLKDRGKPAGIIWCALANRANRIAYAMVRDQSLYDPARWR